MISKLVGIACACLVGMLVLLVWGFGSAPGGGWDSNPDGPDQILQGITGLGIVVVVLLAAVIGISFISLKK